MLPDTSKLEIIGHNFRNSYEQSVTSYGDVFQNDNDDPPACRTAFLLEYGNAGFSSNDGKRSWQADRRPGQTVPISEWRQEDPGVMPAGDVYGGGSPTGIAFYEDGALGKDNRGLLLSCEPGRNVVFGYKPVPDGAGFKLERFDFITSNKEGEYSGTDFKGGRRLPDPELKIMFRPSDVTVGTDGAIYVADWFDARVGGHADWDDTLSGTIYRIAPKGFKSKVAKVDFGTVDGAITGLRSPAVNVRGTAGLALVAMGDKALKPVTKLLRDENPYVRARAVWILSQLGAEGIKQVEGELRNKDAQTRVVAFRALRRQNHNLLATASKLAVDPSPAVRREVSLAMRDMTFAQSKDILLAVAKGYDGKDRTYLEAWGTGAKGKESQVYDFIKPVLNNPDAVKWTPQFAGLAWRLHTPQSIADFKERALAKTLSAADRKAAVTVVGFNSSKEAAEAMLEIAAKADGPAKADAFWWLMNRKDSTWKEHQLGSELKKRGIYDPETVEITPASMPAAEPAKYAVADVLKLKGNAKAGATKAAACYACHRVGANGLDYAPELTGWASRQTTEVLINSLINPSADIAAGYTGYELTLKNNEVIHGLVLSDGDPTIIQSAGGLTQMVPKNRIAGKKNLGRSLMMSADQMGLTPQDLADIAAYLKTVK